MLITPSFKKSLIVEQFQGNYLNLAFYSILGHGRSQMIPSVGPLEKFLTFNYLNYCDRQLTDLLQALDYATFTVYLIVYKGVDCHSKTL